MRPRNRAHGRIDMAGWAQASLIEPASETRMFEGAGPRSGLFLQPGMRTPETSLHSCVGADPKVSMCANP